MVQDGPRKDDGAAEDGSEGRRRFALAEELANLGTWSLDPATGLTSLSQQAAAILQLPAGERVHLAGLIARVAPEDRFATMRSMIRALAGDQARMLCQVRLAMPDGDERTLIVNARRDHRPRRRPTLFGIVQDLGRLGVADLSVPAAPDPFAILGRPSGAAARDQGIQLVSTDAPGGAIRMLRILVAEDDAISQALVAAMMRRRGHRVTCVDNGRRAIEAALAMPFDCILMDMNMPEIDGVQATRAIREAGGRHGLIPIIALTVDAMPERRRFYENIGLSAFLTKPVDSHELFAAIDLIASAPPVCETRPGPVPAIDFKHLHEIQAAIGVKKLERLLEMACAELSARPPAMRAIADSNDLGLLRKEAHGFKGAVASVGLVAVARAAKAVELALPGAELHHSLDRLESESNRALVAVQSYLAGGGRKVAAGA